MASLSDRIEKRLELNAPIGRVWQALTDYREFGAWFGVRLDRPFVVGQVSHGQKTNPCYAHLKWTATITAMRPQSHFAFTWQPYAIDPKVDYSRHAPTLVEFKLTPTAAGTLLVVTESGFDKIPAELRSETLLRNENGWIEQMKNVARHVASHVVA